MIHAKKSIKITTPYFMPPRWMIALLDDAQRRGITVEIMIPYDTDVKTLNKINYYYINKLTSMGIVFHAIKQMNHAKMMIIDDNE
jgi:cardiolipin synthase